MARPTLKRKTDFRVWAELMGFNGQSISKAARLIGIETPTLASKLNTGGRELTQTERLAMAAVRAGLEPWSPEADERITSAGRATSTDA
ncbi:hypothetical protein [uncultured Nitratireductor sp.]|uniref:hypothetical protein n=1 Tax=uncultured Nitratireductor sp. TaxID=520953 RepID=UPI00263638F9|nr:hypothetical protein [uncultured Nitratireductor sp.]